MLDMNKPLSGERAAELGFKVYDGVSFPAVVTPDSTESATAANVALWAEKFGRKRLEADLEQHGAVLFRGLKLRDATEFYDFIRRFDGLAFSTTSPNGGGGPRKNVVGPVHTSTESPKEFRIPFHHELAYITDSPSKLFFFCEVAPQTRGETPLLLSSRIVRRLEEERPEFVDRLRRLGVRYVRTLDADTGEYQRGWRDAFSADSHEQAEANAKLCGTERIEWLSGDRMRVTTKTFHAIVDEKRTGVPTWFNAVCLLHPAAHGEKASASTSENDGAADADRLWNVTYGDGSSIDGEDVLLAKRVMDEEGTAFRWQQGDVLAVDNYLALHSRNSFEPPRRILVAMTL